MSPNVVITGASRGIGLALCKRYLKLGYNVYAACRKASPELKNLQVRLIEQVDVASAVGVENLKQALKNVPVDVLINNAGIFSNQTLGHFDFEAAQHMFAVNALGPLRVTEALYGHMGPGSRVALITSRMGSIADNGSGGYYDYRMSKAALNAAGKTMALELAQSGIAVAIIHPGFVQTEMVGGMGDISADTAAERISDRIKELNLQNTGTFWHSNGEELPW